jgi:hypothetical protein
MSPHRVHTQFFDEIIQAFYERWTIVFTDLQDIRSVLDHDFFWNGIRPDMCTLSSLTVRVRLFDDEITGELPIDAAKLAEELALLLCPGQVSRHFNLHIIFLPTGYFPTDEMETWMWLDQEEYRPRLRDRMHVLELSLKSIKPVIDGLQRISVSGRVRTTMSLDIYTCTDCNLVIFDKNDWADKSALARMRLRSGRMKSLTVAMHEAYKHGV